VPHRSAGPWRTWTATARWICCSTSRRRNSTLYPDSTKATLTEDGLANVVLTSPDIGGMAVVTARAADADGQTEIGFEVMASENRIYLPLICKE
jgi:hypothetical protein